MLIRIILAISLLALAAGFVFFAFNVIWLGTREFFRVYGPRRGKTKTSPPAP